jgi:uncharacterized protein YbcI
MSIKTDISILSKEENRNEFNELLRDLVHEYPNKRLQHILLSLKDHFDIIELFNLLDEQNKFILEKHYCEEDGLTGTADKKKSNRKK